MCVLLFIRLQPVYIVSGETSRADVTDRRNIAIPLVPVWSRPDRCHFWNRNKRRVH
jgi:hypothetical protein